ncbi:4Fe-4S dicluster domain-containing protein, partial [Aromatoleum toluclasticum]|uniref:4Fe-4S dicluster domain-containing protein n=1 Tax=Aromatoleum toluclasticum TaxID=92003 RepID=UPI001D188E79
MSTSRRGFLRGRFRADPDMLRPPWAVPEGVFEDVCTRCGDCLKACPPAILVSAPGGYPVVDFSRGECSFCGDCVAACKAEAL